MSSSDNQRNFLRHPTDVPIQIEIGDVVTHEEEFLKDISFGGLCFRSKISIDQGRIINIRIPLLRPVFHAKGRVVWCEPVGDHFEVGVQFIEISDAFKVRMAEQVCMIEQYQKDIWEKESRKLTGTEAAIEWITKFAAEFSDKG